jgi:hypothetical protein
MPLLATCTAAPEAGSRENEGIVSNAGEDERLVTMLIDGASAGAR